MEVEGYKPRIADTMLAQRLEAKGAVVVEGAKWCGKTYTAMRGAQSALFLGNPMTRTQNEVALATQPGLLLDGARPRLLDEWQEFPQIWDAVRYAVDWSPELGQFILTGSAVPADASKIRHTGTGRFTWMKMRPMTLYESSESTGQVSLRALFAGQSLPMTRGILNIKGLSFAICRGGWPRAVTLSQQAALAQAIDYVDAVVRFDISRVDGVARNELTARRVLRSYARHQGLQSTLATIRDDVNGSDAHGISADTLSAYISALRQIYVIEDAPAWNPNLRSRTAIRTSDTRYFVDPSIAAAALGFGPGDVLADLKTMGMMTETLCIRDLRVYAEAIGGNIFHYRDRNGLECDAVVHLRNGAYGLVEIKLGGDSLIEQGAASLKRLASLIDVQKMPSPSFLMVLTGVGDFAYHRPDGVLVVPVSTLGV